MHNRKNPWILVLLLLAGALIGGFAGELLSRYSFFAWMNFGSADGYRKLLAFSLDPMIDTGIFRFGLNIEMRINAGSIIGMILGLLIFLRK